MSLIKFGSNKEEQEHYWTLIIEEGWVQSAIWVINAKEEASEVVSYSSPVRFENDDDLIETVDTSLSATIASLSEELKEPSKTVFGVPSSWVSNGQITADYLEKIRHICSKLSLEPTGFVVLSEAIAFFIKTKEGSPLNAVVIGLSAANLELSIFKLGKLAGNTKVARSVSLFDDIVEGLSRFADGTPLPSRFLIYDGKEGEMDEAKEALVSADWSANISDKVKFVHSPKVETVSVDDKVAAVSLAGSSEIGKVKSVVMKTNGDAKHEEKVEVTDAVSNIQEMEDEVTADQLGFVSDGEVVADSPPVEPETQMPKEKPKFKISSPTPSGRKTLTVGLLVFFISLVGLVLAWWFLPKATVTIFISPRTLQEKATISIDVNTSKADFEAKIIPGRLEKLSVDGTKTKSTSGTKVVGDKAKGVVKVRNGTAIDVSFTTGTVMEGPNGLKFSLDESVSVSAAVSPTSPGTASVPVTAEAIGSEYNLAKDETFKLSNYPKSEIDAISENDFSGGSSREIAAVSQDDVDDLEKALTDELKAQAEEKITATLGATEIFIEGTLMSSVVERDFSDKVGDEASSVELVLSLEVSALVVGADDLNNLASKLLEDETPPGFLFKSDQVDKTFKLVSQDVGVYEIAISFVANLLPDLAIDEITGKISGKYTDVASDYLQTIPGFRRAEIEINPRFPGRLGTLPKVKNNISIGISASK